MGRPVKFRPVIDTTVSTLKSKKKKIVIDCLTTAVSPRKELNKKSPGLGSIQSARNLKTTLQKQNSNKFNIQVQKKAYNLQNEKKNLEIEPFFMVKQWNKQEFLPQVQIRIQQQKLISPKSKQFIEKQQDKQKNNNFYLNNNINLRKKNSTNKKNIQVEGEKKQFTEQRKFCNLSNHSSQGFIDKNDIKWGQEYLNAKKSINISKSWDMNDFKCEQSKMLEIKEYEKMKVQYQRRSECFRKLKFLKQLQLFDQK